MTQTDHAPARCGVRIVGAYIRYGNYEAVSDVHLDIAPGHVHAILGTSGSGKTTLLRALAGFERVVRGSICIGDREVDAPNAPFVPPERRGVGVVFQDYALFPHLSVAKNIAFGMRSGSAKATEEHLERIGLGGCGGRMPSQLSGGEQQRVALARALAMRPNVLLLDEPFSNLDPSRRADLRARTLQLVRKEGVTAVLVTHAADEAIEAGDALTVMHAGRVLQTGTPFDLYTAPHTLRVARALGIVNLLPATLSEDRAVTSLGALALSAPAPPRAAAVVVRPEQLQLLALDETSERTAIHEGTITDRRFQGADVVLRVQVATGETLTAVCRPWDAPTGARVEVRVRGAVAAVPMDAEEDERAPHD